MRVFIRDWSCGAKLEELSIRPMAFGTAGTTGSRAWWRAPQPQRAAPVRSPDREPSAREEDARARVRRSRPACRRYSGEGEGRRGYPEGEARPRVRGVHRTPLRALHVRMLL